MYEETEINGWPGLGQEVRDICQEIGIPDINKNYVSKIQIKRAIFRSHYSDMKTKIDK